MVYNSTERYLRWCWCFNRRYRTAATGDFVDLDVDGHTNLDNVSISGVTTIGDVVVGGATTDLIVNGIKVTGILQLNGTVVITETTVKQEHNVHIGVELQVLMFLVQIHLLELVHNSILVQQYSLYCNCWCILWRWFNLSGITAAGTGDWWSNSQGLDGVVGTAGSISSLDFSGSSGLSVMNALVLLV